jgi:hypothetical protein
MQKLPAHIDDLLTCHGRARETAFERSSSARRSKPLPALGPIWWSNPINASSLSAATGSIYCIAWPVVDFVRLGVLSDDGIFCAGW